MGDDDVVEALAADGGDAVVDRAVQAEARTPQHGRATRLRPRRDAVVVTRHERGERAGGRDHAVRHPACEASPRVVGHVRGQPALRSAERLHGNEQRRRHGADTIGHGPVPNRRSGSPLPRRTRTLAS